MISSIEKMTKILDLFSHDHPSLGNKEIAEWLGIHQSSAHHLIKTMCKEGILIQDNNRRYRLGWKLLEWSNKVMYQEDIHNEAGPIIGNLVRHYKGTSHIGMFHEGEVRFVFKMTSCEIDPISTYIGARKPAYCTSSGKVLLAYNPSFLRPTMAKGLLKQSNNTITSINDLERELKLIRKQGYAISDDENDHGLYGVAAPIYSYNGDVVASVNFVGERHYMKVNLPHIIRSVVSSAQTISKQLGFISFA
ncbi:IclR family transcriptional regulator, KDG regulon repressor [Cytobacillus horneckiae]|uniref:IclR family transcriptional regulator n=1 Tax=Cytobacillus horneckiae TaxID=549687 RepID=A0A2N0ZA88_9BACI|nr:IclR family transcriptional regulator [Cytobacillus horneckiae]MBN6886798.1 IclR family transcriptional regulator [Cytobacillus horneckiae]MCM3177731.1 IclR family transcriptional regulator [Cytobacillus horneckiae]MEC1158046.1 IclR family transcriptional regulator [Cytobacillus horneckiae]MED2937029.1 IclR family transcriptional regulator [Cytobacillus horneckiae]PKG26422.1 IclR family transcriptional regulator [Cytobacillus horneckiae]